MRSGGAAASSLQLVDQGAEQRVGVDGLAGDVADLSLDLRRLGERAQLQADDGAVDPGARLGKGVIGHGQTTKPSREGFEFGGCGGRI